MTHKKRVEKIIRDIKDIKIQGARRIAREALRAYTLVPTESTKRKLLSARPTEPMLMNVLHRLEKQPYKEILRHFDSAQEKINKNTLRLIKKDDVIFTHCHSTNVLNSLIYAKKKKKKFEVYNTETRPLFQGRKTARELKKAKIKVTMFVDSAVGVALSREQETRKVDKVFLGADALLKKGVVNKIGSEVIAQLARKEKIPVYIIADSWKYTPKKIKLEERDFHEVWKKLSRNSKIKVRNPAFEFVPKKYIKAVVSEYGILSYGEFLKKVKKK
jgi:ribose 1,5-bisphosphate isomerase